MVSGTNHGRHDTDSCIETLDLKSLWECVVRQFPLDTSSIHGPGHWRQVELNGFMLAEETRADMTVVRLFAIFHDSRRENDGVDHDHGMRGAELAKGMRGVYYDVPDRSFELLIRACRYHTERVSDPDITIATCWDADRLDLPRVGITLDTERMATAYGKRLARDGKNLQG
jgi:uncharacterized protein